jgi:hypothetical protein
MEPEESVAFAFLVCEYLEGKKSRKCRVHSISAVRYRNGHFYTLYTPLRDDLAKFFNYFRMRASSFDGLLSRLQDDLKKSDTTMRAVIKLEDMLETLERNNTTLKHSSRRKHTSNNSGERKPDPTSDGR